MAHALRYYKDLVQPNGTIIRLEIHRKKDGDALWVAKEIGRVVQALHLDIQGGADTIDAPIVKTSLTMTFVDAPDLEAGKKCGDWEEFYTPDSTMWMVVLKADDKTIWGGYVTPDSYQEDLRYRGSVTIIARDNIGHMQDFPFDMEGNADGMVTLEQLVNEAWAKIESPMRLDWWHEEQEAMYLMCEGNDAPSTYMNVSAFEDMNFFDAVEKALYSYGLVMRYTGSNRVTISSLRDLPYQGKSSAPRAIEPTFLAHAQRELAPAVRRIEESVRYDFTDGVQIPLAKSIEFTGASYTAPFFSTDIFGDTTRKDIPVHPIEENNGDGWSNFPSSTLFFNPKRYTIVDAYLQEDAERMLFLACNTDNTHFVIYRKTMVCRDFRINMNFGRIVQRKGNAVQYCYGFAAGTENNGIGSIRVKKVSCYISVDQNGITQYYNGAGWQTDAYLIKLEQGESGFGIDVGFYGMTGVVQAAITIESIELDAMRDYSDGDGLYAPLSSMYWGVSESSSLCETNNVNTIYINTNNVILERSPELAPALDEVPFPSVIKNGIFVKSGSAYLPARGWAWRGGTPQQMAVYNHLQMLCYHSKPNNVISGDIVHFDALNMKAIYEWGGADHLLVSGSYNFLNGRIESAVLREFKFYYEMWGDIPDSQLPPSEQTNRTTAEGGYSTSNNATYEETTNVSIYAGGGGSTIVVDTEMSDTSTNPVQNKVVKKYIDDEVVYLEGHAESVANDAEANAKKYIDGRVRELHWADEDAGETLTEEQKAYNAETYRMFAEGLTPIVVLVGIVGSGIWYEDEELGAAVDLLFKVDWGGVLLMASFCLREDGSVEVVEMIYTEKLLNLTNKYSAQTFFENYGVFTELKGVIIPLEGGTSEVDAVGYNGRHYVEYNLHDKRYRAEFNADYTINKTIDITPAGGGDSSDVIRVRGLSTAELFPMSLLEIYFPDNEYLQEFLKKTTLTREIANGLLPLMSEAYGEEIAAQFESVFDSFFAINQAAYSKLSQKVAQGEAVSVIVEYSSILIDGGIISSVGSVISGESSGSFEVTVVYDGNIQRIVVTPRMTIFENGSVILDLPTNVVYFNTTGQLTPQAKRQNIFVLNDLDSATHYLILSDRSHQYTSLWSTASNDAIGFIDENGTSRVLTINDDGTSYITPPFTTSETE